MREGRERWDSGNVALIGVDVLEALRVVAVIDAVRSVPLVELPFSISSLFNGLSMALVLAPSPPRGSPSGLSSTRLSPFRFISSLVESLISGILRPVEFATLPISGVFAETPLPLVCLFDAKDCARWRESGKIACEEF